MIWWQPDPCVHQNRQYYGTIERRNDSGRLKLATTVEQTGYGSIMDWRFLYFSTRVRRGLHHNIARYVGTAL
ncbi:hypothetical protein V5799_004668 [Amblyomma americanum]|uniref:Uncharacterized protein n=1 Tax=Amblyomma americanum TaxID=6943 RepID=A0AAQ4D5F9_AMBAM